MEPSAQLQMIMCVSCCMNSPLPHLFVDPPFLRPVEGGRPDLAVSTVRAASVIASVTTMWMYAQIHACADQPIQIGVTLWNMNFPLNVSESINLQVNLHAKTKEP
mmetsp:Transcript_45604/g.89826  ORF Transcript_45604/g.89826 Transcript_45604/m.89826 type:complete len:105 (-) Transcript_45604:175-489(-)